MRKRSSLPWLVHPLQDLRFQQQLIGFELAALAVKFAEDFYLALEDVGFEGLGQVIDRAQFVALELKPEILHSGGDEDDGEVPRLGVGAHQFGGLEPVHAGHLHVEQHQREILLQGKAQRIVA